MRAEVSEATDQVAPRVFQPKRVYPNKQVSEGGTLHMIYVEDLPLMFLKSGCSLLRSMRVILNAPLKRSPT